MIRREQACAGSKERKRKLENSNNAAKSITATSTSSTSTAATATTTTATLTTTPTTLAPSSSATSSAAGGPASAATCLGLGIDQLGLNGATQAVDAGKDSVKDGKADAEAGPDASVSFVRTAIFFLLMMNIQNRQE